MQRGSKQYLELLKSCCRKKAKSKTENKNNAVKRNSVVGLFLRFLFVFNRFIFALLLQFVSCNVCFCCQFFRIFVIVFRIAKLCALLQTRSLLCFCCCFLFVRFVYFVPFVYSFLDFFYFSLWPHQSQPEFSFYAYELLIKRLAEAELSYNRKRFATILQRKLTLN